MIIEINDHTLYLLIFAECGLGNLENNARNVPGNNI